MSKMSKEPDALFLTINPFDLKAEVRYGENRNNDKPMIYPLAGRPVYIELDKIAEYVANHQHPITHIIMGGAPIEYCEGLKQQIEYSLITEYSNNNVKIEVI